VFRLDGAAPRPACVSCECLRRSGVALGEPQINTMSTPLPTPARKSGLPTAYARIVLSGSRTRPSGHRLDTTNGPSSMLMPASLLQRLHYNGPRLGGAHPCTAVVGTPPMQSFCRSPLSRGSPASWTGRAP
jgi:hypothetical protein